MIHADRVGRNIFLSCMSKSGRNQACFITLSSKAKVCLVAKIQVPSSSLFGDPIWSLYIGDTPFKVFSRPVHSANECDVEVFLYKYDCTDFLFRYLSNQVHIIRSMTIKIQNKFNMSVTKWSMTNCDKYEFRAKFSKRHCMCTVQSQSSIRCVCAAQHRCCCRE